MAAVHASLRSPREHLPPIRPLAGPTVQLFLTSFTLLFVELILIRWIPSLVTYVGFFSNFLLMASFLGIGLGILLGRRGGALVASPFPVLLLATMALVTSAQLNVQLHSAGEIFFGLAENQSADVNFLVLPLVVLLVVALMATLALPLGPLLRSMAPLRAYAVDISGSMAGIAGFALVSLAGTPPGVWYAIVAALLLLLALGRGPTLWSAVGGVAMAAVVLGGFLNPTNVTQLWSPYYRIDIFPDNRGTEHLSVNGIPHQAMWPVADERKNPFYEQVYKWFPDRTFDRVLIVGAGSGTDTALALAHGAAHIDAVEIDPTIQAIGRDRNPDHPYGDPRVTSYINDGRAYLRTTAARYDLVIFALPDSLTLVSSTANLRLESFLFTDEAFASVRDHLAPNGLFVLYNYYREPWLITKLDSQLTATFGTPPLLRTYPGNQAAMADGPLVTAINGHPPGDVVDPVPSVGSPVPRHATDDWPFTYLRTPFIAPYYLLALGFMLVISVLGVWAAARRSGAAARRFSPHFFVLGVAFLLLETKSLVSFSLLFGTTWIVNALAFFAILAGVLLAIGVQAAVRPRSGWPFYAGLLVSLALAFALPPERLLIDPPALRYGLAAALAFAPVFFANLVFTYSFRDTKSADMAFASNLLGAMLGGVLEYLALLTGYQLLIVVVAGLYAVAYLLATRVRLLADRELSSPDRSATPIPATAGAGD
jgi:SAM-dependent methyltransferase